MTKRKRVNKDNEQRTIINMIDINPTTLITILSCEQLKDRLSEWIKKTRPIYMLFTRNPL